MNAFDPNYIKTYYPDMMKQHILSSKSSLGMTKFLEKKRHESPNHGKTRLTEDEFLLPKQFAVYSRAGVK